MYICDCCKKSSRPYETLTLVPETVAHTHPKREHANDPGGNGTRIVREAKVCPRCT